jgi:16S rRNA (guanine966-N2)-methyltransferase
MPDRVKEAVFNILGSRYECPGALPPLLVTDVFAGSGSMGLEALSRGAASCSFFERDRHALDALRRNIQSLGAEGASTIIMRDAWRSAVSRADGSPFDLVFLDPPYRESRDSSERGLVRRYLARFDRLGDKGTLIVLHHPSTVRYEAREADSWQIVDQRTFGTSAITIFAR